MGFKDQVAADIANVFINFDEFADNHVINGVSVLAVLDSDINQARAFNRLISVNDGVSLQLVSLFVKLSDFGYQPVEGEHMTVDGKGYFVSECLENIGVLEIKLKANVS